MNKKVIIVGVLGLFGIGAYFYFKEKSKTNEILAGQTSDNSLNVPPKGATLSNPEEVIDLAKKTTDARALSNKINLLRKEKEELISNPKKRLIRKYPLETLNNKKKLISIVKNRTNEIDKQIVDFKRFIKNFGYNEKNGKIIRIV
jgi:hypothetical protein